MNTIGHFNPSVEFYTDERCYILELHNGPDDPACSIARARVQPGVTTQLHCLRGIMERYVVLEGEGSVEVGGAGAAKVALLDVVHIPAAVSQRITNIGTTDLVLLCICTPRFVPDAYVHVESLIP